jgi:hypothetical protein
MNIKTDPTTKILLGIIATGVAALTALAFEKRYQACRSSGNPAEGDDANSLRNRIEDGVDSLKEKAGVWKEKVSDGFERVTEKVKDGIKHGGEVLKEETKDAAEETK